MNKTAFIGAGNMGGAIIEAMIKSNKYLPEDIYVYDKALRDEIRALGITASTLSESIKCCDVVVLAVKPNVIFDVIEEIKKTGLAKDKLFVSIAAGVKLCDLCDALGTKNVVRVMPNLCLASFEGMCVIARADGVDDASLCRAEKIFASGGKTAIVEEDLIDSCTAINGSGPAYVFMFIDALTKAAMSHGIDKDTALLLSTQTVLGSARLLGDTGLEPSTLKDRVCSPGGTTIEAVAVFEKLGLDNIVKEAVDACVKKAVILSQKK